MKKTILTIALASALALSGCTLTTGQKVERLNASVVKKWCDTFAPITYDGKLDTPLTKEQIREYNAKRGAFCAVKTTR